MQYNTQSALPTHHVAIKDALDALKRNRNLLTRQQTRTLHGQIINGHCAEAMAGLDTIIRRKRVGGKK